MDQGAGPRPRTSIIRIPAGGAWPGSMCMELEVPDPFPEYLYRKAHDRYGVVVGEEEGEGGVDDVGEFDGDEEEEEDQDWTRHGRVLAVHMPAAAVAAARSAQGKGRGAGGSGGGGGGGNGGVLRISLPREEPGDDDDDALDLRVVDMYNDRRGEEGDAEGESAEEQEARFLRGLHRPDENMEPRPLSFTYAQPTVVNMPFLGGQARRRRRGGNQDRDSRGVSPFVELVAFVVLLVSALVIIDRIFMSWWMPDISNDGIIIDGFNNWPQHHDRDAHQHYIPSSGTIEKAFESINEDLGRAWSWVLDGIGAGGANQIVHDHGTHGRQDDDKPHQPHISSSLDGSLSSTDDTETQTQTQTQTQIKQSSQAKKKELQKILRSLLTARTHISHISSGVHNVATNLSHAMSSPGALTRLAQSESQQEEEQQQQISFGSRSSHAITKLAMGQVPPAPAYQGGFLPYNIHLHRQKACAAVLSTWYAGYPKSSQQLRPIDRKVREHPSFHRFYQTEDQAYSAYRRQRQGDEEGEGGQDGVFVSVPRIGLPWEPRANLGLLGETDAELFGPEFRFHARVHRRCSGMWKFVWGDLQSWGGEAVGLGRAPELVLGSSGGGTTAKTTRTWTGRGRDDDDDDFDHEGGGGRGTYQLWWSNSASLMPGLEGVDFIKRIGEVMDYLEKFRDAASQGLGLMEMVARGGGEGQDPAVKTDSSKDMLLLEGSEMTPDHQGGTVQGGSGPSSGRQDLDLRLSRLAVSMRLVEAVANMTVNHISGLAPKGGFSRPRGLDLPGYGISLELHDMVDDAGELVRRAAVESAVDEELIALIEAWIASATRHSTPYWRPDAGADADADTTAAAPLVSSTSWRWADMTDWVTFRRRLYANETSGNFSLLRWLKRDVLLGMDAVSPQAIRTQRKRKKSKAELDKETASAAVRHWRALLPWRDDYAIEWESLHAHLSHALLAAEGTRRSAQDLALGARDLADQLAGVLAMLRRGSGVGDDDEDDMEMARAVLGAGGELLDALRLALQEFVSGPESMTALMDTYSGIVKSGRG